MGQVLHGSATKPALGLDRGTEAVRRAIQHSQESLRALAGRYGINQKTVAKWKKRSSVSDTPTGPKNPKSTVLSIEEEAIIVAFRKHTLLPLDDCLYALQATIPNLTRLPCIVACNVTVSPGCRTWEATSRTRRSSSPTPLGTFTSILPKCRPPKASSTFMLPLIARVNLPLSSLCKRLAGHQLPLFWRP